MSTLDLPSNSDMSAPATNELGFGRLPSGGSFGPAPVMTMTLTVQFFWTIDGPNRYHSTCWAGRFRWDIFDLKHVGFWRCAHVVP